MNTEDDSIISQLPLTHSDIKRLSLSQIRSIKTLLVQPPEHLLSATRNINHDQLIEAFRIHKIPIHAVEFPFAQLIRFVRDLIPEWKMTSQEENDISSSISRCTLVDM